MATQINKKLAGQIAADVIKALEAVAAKYDLKVKNTGGKFSPTTFAPGVEFFVEGQSFEQEAFRLNCFTFGLKPEWLGKTFRQQGMTFTIEGLAPKSYKRPVIAVTDNGKRYKFPVETIQLHMKDVKAT